MVTFAPFLLERWQSLHEHDVEINLADSGVAPLSLAELLGDCPRDALFSLPLTYPEVRGTRRLRERIAALYPDAGADDVLVTVGAAEANAIVAQTLIQPDDEVVVIDPNYQQIPGLAENLGARVRSVPLGADRGSGLDLDAVASAIGPRTRLVYLSNPNNPTGRVLTADESTTLVELTDRYGAWLLADEVYRGSERITEQETPTLWKAHERVIAVGSMSKAYGLSGLRIGWMLAPEEALAECWRRHEYATIAAGAADMLLASIALGVRARPRILERSRALVRRGWDVTLEWAARHRDLVELEPGDATALALVRYRLSLDSVRVAEAIRRDADVLVAPGAYLGAEGHLRINHADSPETLPDGLNRIAGVLEALSARHPVPR